MYFRTQNLFWYFLSRYAGTLVILSSRLYIFIYDNHHYMNFFLKRRRYVRCFLNKVLFTQPFLLDYPIYRISRSFLYSKITATVAGQKYNLNFMKENISFLK